jgi:hypothetical protein
MMNAQQKAAEILHWGRTHGWHSKAASRLKAKHEEYMRELLSRMDELNEYAMNRAWAAMPTSVKLSDAGSRVVCELIVCYCSATKE